MEEVLMLKIKNDLAELKYNDYKEITDIKMFTNIEGNIVVTYKINGDTHLICDDIIESEVK